MIKSNQVEDAFEKTRRFDRADEAHALGLYPYFKEIAKHNGGTVLVDGEEFILTGSNDYLGLTQDRRLVEAAEQALETFGTSCTGSRFLTGTLTLHHELERALAEFLGKEATLVFSAGFLACASSVSALAGRNDIIYFDRENHASLYDGAKLSYATLRRFHHGDAADLERLLAADADKPGGRLVYTDGVFSMSGHIAKLPALVEVAKRYGARVIVDEAHASGVLGATGAGTAEHYGLTDGVDLLVGTFSKSFASVGGFVAGPRHVIEFIKHTARPFIFNAALPAGNAAAALAALRIMQSEPQHRETLWRNVNFMRENLLTLGFDLLGSETPIIPVLAGSDDTAVRFWKGLWNEHIFTTPSVPPAVPQGMSLIRTSYNSAHNQEHLEKVLVAFEKVGKALGVIS
ncbi:MAG TPA: pyridoxal phosphate-dependent aminotransferase family protein [Deinococcales bacterium]|nr:pyridoxal phosphate-dependent aminotransferase family protein [Deinococcales bacterium]